MSLLVILLAIAYGHRYIPVLPDHPAAHRVGVVQSMAAWDGEWYARIATSGYFYDPVKFSNIVFFPAYPLLGRIFVYLTGLSMEASLLVIANACFLATFVMLSRYIRSTRSERDGSTTAVYSLLSLAFWPAGFYFRMTYTESLFILLTVIALHGMNRRWPASIIACIIGLATATRSVGIALLAPFVYHLWEISNTHVTSGRCISVQSAARMTRLLRPTFEGATIPQRLRQFVVSAVLLLPLACWGILAFMSYQRNVFMDPLAFAKAQSAWYVREMPGSVWSRCVGLVTLEPLRAVYSPTSPCYWAREAPADNAILNLHFMNPIFFVASTTLLVIGIWKQLLTRAELLLSAFLLLIPYVMQSGRMGMISQARFTSVIFPIYLVIGQILNSLPRVVAAYFICCSALLLAAYTAMFISWYWFF
jgi:hypothetical protein